MSWSETHIIPARGYYRVKRTPLGSLILSWNETFDFQINLGNDWGGNLGVFATPEEAQKKADETWKTLILKTLSAITEGEQS